MALCIILANIIYHHGLASWCQLSLISRTVTHPVALGTDCIQSIMSLVRFLILWAWFGKVFSFGCRVETHTSNSSIIHILFTDYFITCMLFSLCIQDATNICDFKLAFQKSAFTPFWHRIKNCLFHFSVGIQTTGFPPKTIC